MKEDQDILLNEEEHVYMPQPPYPLYNSYHSQQTQTANEQSQFAIFPPPNATRLPEQKLTRRGKPRTNNSEKIEKELKELVYEMAEVPYDKVSMEVRNLEQHIGSTEPHSQKERKTIKELTKLRDRKKQIFGLLFIMRSVEPAPGKLLRRSQLYTCYEALSQRHGLTPMTAASFGKLVKIWLPDVQVRRIGNRVQSKYHYDGIKFVDDFDVNLLANDSAANSVLVSPYGSPCSNSTSQLSQVNHTNSLITDSPSSSISMNSATLIPEFPSQSPTNQMVLQSELAGPRLSFKSDFLQSGFYYNDSDTFELPSIFSYLHKGDDDANAALALSEMYSQQCITVFECFRHMQLKRLFNCISNFAASLSLPLYRLLTLGSTIPWVVKCDLVLYRHIMKMLGNLTWQSVPLPVLKQLKIISVKLPERISMLKLPPDLINAKLRAAKRFADLVSRWVRVSEARNTAARVLMSPHDRQLMLGNWQDSVNFPELVAKELPCQGENSMRVVELLTLEVPELFRRIDQTPDSDSIIKDVALFLLSIPKRFHDVAPRLILLCTSTILTAALREVSLAGGEGFGAWWVFRCWIDEWLGWCAELGGFLEVDFHVQMMSATGREKYEQHVSDYGVDEAVAEAMGDGSVDLLEKKFGL